MRGPTPPVATSVETTYQEALAAVILFSPIFFLALLIGSQVISAIGVAYFCAMAALILARRRAIARARLFLERHEFRICPGCRHDLTRGPEHGACPGCRRPYRHDQLQALWWETYEMPPDRHRRLIRPEDILRCAACGYSLEGLAEEGLCPECGVLYTPEVFRVARSLRQGR